MPNDKPKLSKAERIRLRPSLEAIEHLMEPREYANVWNQLALKNKYHVRLVLTGVIEADSVKDVKEGYCADPGWLESELACESIDVELAEEEPGE